MPDTHDTALSRPAAAAPSVAMSAAERRRAFQILFFALVWMGSGQSLMFAILPSLARDLGLTEFLVGAIFSVSATIWVFTSPYWGRRSDVWGRKPVILIGLCAFGLSMLLFSGVIALEMAGIIAGAALFPLLVATRAIYGIAGSGAHPAAQAYVADRTTAHERASGVATLGAAFGLGVTLGPGIGAALVVFGVLAPLFFVALLALASAVAVWWFLPERTMPVLRPDQPKLSWRDPRVLPFILFSLIANTIGAVPIQTMAFLFRDALNLSASDTAQFAGVGLMASSMAGLFAQLVLVQRLRLTSTQLIQWGTVLAGLSFAIFAVATQFGPLILGAVLSGLGFGLLRPGFSAAASLNVRPWEQGAVAGLLGSTAGAGWIFAPLLGGGLYEKVHHSAPFVLGVVVMAGLLAYALLEPRLKANALDIREDEDQPAG